VQWLVQLLVQMATHALSQTQHHNMEGINKQDANTSILQQRESSRLNQHLLLCQNTRNNVRRISNWSWPLPLTLTPTVLIYFQFDADQTNKESYIAILHLLAPAAKGLSKSKDVQCQLNIQQVVPLLCKSSLTRRSLTSRWSLHP